MEDKITNLYIIKFNVDATSLELAEQKAKETCVIEYNVPDLNKNTGFERKEEDQKAAASVLPLQIAETDFKVYRIVKPIVRKTRLLKVDLLSIKAT